MTRLAEQILQFCADYDDYWETQYGDNPWFEKRNQIPLYAIEAAVRSDARYHLTYEPWYTYNQDGHQQRESKSTIMATIHRDGHNLARTYVCKR